MGNMTRYFTKQKTQMAHKRKTSCQVSLGIRKKCSLNSSCDFIVYPADYKKFVFVFVFLNLNNVVYGSGCGAVDPSHISGRSKNSLEKTWD